MAVLPQAIITASDYNTLQNRIEQILGTGSAIENTGYGQTVTSGQVAGPGPSSDGDIVDHERMQELWDDMDRAYKHQNGSNLGLTQLATGDLIGADVSTSDLPAFSDEDADNDGNIDYSLSNIDNTQGFNDYLTIMTALEAGKDTVAVAETVSDGAIVPGGDARTTSFNGTIDSEFTVTFSSDDALRHFFNAGGQILIEGTVENVSDTTATNNNAVLRNQGWQSMIENPGTIAFGYNYTTIDGQSTGVTYPDGAIGQRQLTTTFQTIFRRDASASTYGDSYWTIEARIESSLTRRLRFKLTLVDDGPESNLDAGAKGSIEPGVTEPVTANILFDYGARRPRSLDFETDGTTRRFTLPYPTFANPNTFE